MVVVKSRPYYFHIKFNNKPFLTVAAELVNDAVHVGLAFKATNDNFCRRIGRQISYNRLQLNLINPEKVNRFAFIGSLAECMDFVDDRIFELEPRFFGLQLVDSQYAEIETQLLHMKDFLRKQQGITLHPIVATEILQDGA